MKLHEQNNWGYKRIGHMLGISIWTVRDWIKRGRSPYTRLKLLRKSAKTPSWELGYVLGVLCGDAHISANSIELKTTKVEWAETFLKILEAWSGYTPKWYEYNGKSFGKTLHFYRVVLHGKDIVTFFTQIGKFGTKVWQVPKTISDNKVMQKGFLSGFFDSEGWASGGDIRACSSNLSGLQQVKELLMLFNIHSKIYSMTGGCKKRVYYYLRTMGGRKSLQLFRKEIGFMIVSKSKKLLNYLEGGGAIGMQKKEGMELQPSK